MASVDGAVLDLRRLDLLATGETAIHHLDPRVKVVVTIVYIVSIVSFGRYELTALFPFFIYPAVMVGLGNLPAAYIVKKIAVIIPVALIVGICNPLFDREVMLYLGSIGITGGWISFASIIIRAILTISAAVILVAVTGFPAICRALERLRVPQLFAGQLLLLYRYIFVLTEEVARTSRARELRSFGKKGMGIKPFGSLVGHLLLRTWQRAERIHAAMLARGFSGEFHPRTSGRFGVREVCFLIGWSTLFIVLRLWNASQVLGSLVTGLFP